MPNTLLRYLFAMVLLTAGCLATDDGGRSSDSDDDGGGPGWVMPPTGNENTGNGTDTRDNTTNSSGGLACHLDVGSEDCVDCARSNCGTVLRTAFGVADVPTVPGGVCSSTLSCFQGCACGDDECVFSCFGAITEQCGEAMGAVQECVEEQACAVACEDDNVTEPVDPPDDPIDDPQEPIDELCGNGALDEGESCDPLVELGSDCTDWDYAGGTLVCTGTCELNTDACFSDSGGECSVFEDTIGLGQTITGRLDSTSRISSSFRTESYYQVIQLAIEAPTAVSVQLTSNDFDSYLYILSGACELIDENDDWDDANSQVDYDANPGDYVMVTTYEGGTIGDFMLTVSAPE